MSQRLMVFSDGGARGNPGPAAVAYVALSDSGKTVKTDSRFIGVNTNNQAEYEALIMALKFAASLKIPEVICYLDSELVVKQLNGEYSVKNHGLQLLFNQVQALKIHFIKLCFISVPRSHPHIQRADALVNKKLDEEEQRRMLI